MEKEPMIKLEPGGEAPILSYQIPQPSMYSGRNIIELEFPKNYFRRNLAKKPASDKRTTLKDTDIKDVKTAVLSGMKSGFVDSRLFPNIRMSSGILRFSEKVNPGLGLVTNQPISTKLATLDPDEVASSFQAGKRLNIYTSLFGTLTYNYVDEPQEARPRLLLIENYRLSSYLGDYGAGRTIKTFSLLPGEKTKINIRTYAKRESDKKGASSILDSFTQESADDFETSVQNEQSNKQAYSENFEYHAEAEAKASWGFGSAKVSGGVKGGSNSAREEFSKNLSSAVEKHSAKASAKRDVQIETSFEVKEEAGEETSIEREIQNINVSRTLNFVFRQMNQKFISILHLVDVRVAFFNGFAESKREVSLPELDTLLEDVVVNQTNRQKVRQAIIDQLQNIFDYKDNHHSFVEEKPKKDQDGNDIQNSAYLHVKRDYMSIYKDDSTERKIPVPGIILSARENVLRTDGVIVEALLGQGDALDEYSHGLQDQAVRNQNLNNELLKATIEKNKLAMEIVKNKEKDAAAIFAQVFPPPEKEENSEGDDND